MKLKELLFIDTVVTFIGHLDTPKEILKSEYSETPI
jgi:hypothetical protein